MGKIDHEPAALLNATAEAMRAMAPLVRDLAKDEARYAAALADPRAAARACWRALAEPQKRAFPHYSMYAVALDFLGVDSDPRTTEDLRRLKPALAAFDALPSDVRAGGRAWTRVGATSEPAKPRRSDPRPGDDTSGAQGQADDAPRSAEGDLRAAEEAVERLRTLHAEQPEAHAADLARSLITLAESLSNLGRHEEALAAAQEAVERLRSLHATGPDAAITAYDAVVNRFADAQAPALRALVAMALVDKGVVLGQLDPPPWDVAIAAYDEVVRRFADAPEPALRELVAEALVSKGFALGQLDPPQRDAAIAAYDEVVRRFADAPEPALREKVAMALINKGSALGRLDPPPWDVAIAAYDEVVRRFADAPEPALRELVARALVYKGVALHQLDPLPLVERVQDHLAKIERLAARPDNHNNLSVLLERALLLARRLSRLA